HGGNLIVAGAPGHTPVGVALGQNDKVDAAAVAHHHLGGLGQGQVDGGGEHVLGLGADLIVHHVADEALSHLDADGAGSGVVQGGLAGFIGADAADILAVLIEVHNHAGEGLTLLVGHGGGQGRAGLHGHNGGGAGVADRLRLRDHAVVAAEPVGQGKHGAAVQAAVGVGSGVA